VPGTVPLTGAPNIDIGESAITMASERTLPTLPVGPSIADEPTFVVPRQRARRRPLRRLLRAVLIALVLLVLLAALAGAAVYEDPALLSPLGSVLLGTQPGMVAWNGRDPINVLVMGIDQRTNEQTRSDSIIVLHVDPSSHDVKMLSIPRDLWINMPSPDPNNAFGYTKINGAFALGWLHNQGPQYAALAVESALHIPVHYYTVLKFTGFNAVVNAIGGVTVCVPRTIDDPSYPAPVGNGFDPLHIAAGCQRMNGALALKYARERHAYTQQDLGRIQSQQAILEGITKGLLSPNTLLRAPNILTAANSALITNMPHSMLPQLGLQLARAKGNNIEHDYINQDGGYVTDTTSTDGANILAPNQPKIDALVARLFADPQLQAEHATVQVRSGQNTAGLAAEYTSILNGMGFNTGGFAPRNADHAYTRSLIVVNEDLPGADYTARTLAEMLQADVAYRHIGTDHAQVVAILGSHVAEGS